MLFLLFYSLHLLFSIHLDFRAKREQRDAEEREDKKKILREQKDRERDDQRKRAEAADLRSYSSLMATDRMQSNYDDGNDSDDFM